MKSFGRLLRKLRGVIPLEQLAERTMFPVEYLATIEAGQLPDEFAARLILSKGFALDRRDCTRFILGVHLYDLGLRDSDLRQLVIDLITRTTPEKVREQMRALYQSYQPR